VEAIPVIFNPNARSAKAADRIAAIRELSARILLVPTTGPGDARRLAREFALGGAPTVVAAGGDGTVNEVANGLLSVEGCQTKLGILPAGTMNVLALELGLPKRNLPECWRRIEAGITRTLDIWQLGEAYFLQLAGLGVDAEVIRATTWESKKSLGPFSYGVSAMQLLGKPAPTMSVRKPDGSVVTGEVVLLVNGKHYGGPVRVFAQADNADGLLDVLVMDKGRVGKLLGVLASMYLNQGRKPPAGVHYFQAASLEISAEQPVAMEVDGELLGNGQNLTITQKPGGLQVLI
jgi:diacylglycerol kinase (ATP)